MHNLSIVFFVYKVHVAVLFRTLLIHFNKFGCPYSYFIIYFLRGRLIEINKNTIQDSRNKDIRKYNIIITKINTRVNM